VHFYLNKKKIKKGWGMTGTFKKLNANKNSYKKIYTIS